MRLCSELCCMRTSTSNCIVDKIAHWIEGEGEGERQREKEVEGKRETGVRDSREGEERESDTGCMTYIRY